jgi:hypothetical protein
MGGNLLASEQCSDVCRVLKIGMCQVKAACDGFQEHSTNMGKPMPQTYHLGMIYTTHKNNTLW